MRVGMLGTGDVGKALGTAFIALGHEVRMGSRDAANPRATAWAAAAGPRASAGTMADAAAFGEIIVMATLGTAHPEVVTAAGPRNFSGKLVLDTTNPLDFTQGMPPRLAISGHDSAGELVQRLVPDACVVKAFNTAGNAHMFKPQFPQGPPTMFICGNDDAAKARAADLIRQFGWEIADIGPISGSRYLEAMCIVWVMYGAKHNNWNIAFKLLTK
jgi:predicted dinucleotide-binding enzyme